MDNVLAQLYRGELCPAAKVKPNNARLSALSNKIENEMAYFKQILSEEDAERLVKMDEIHLQATGIEMCDNFVHGFKLGAALMAEVVSNT